MITYFICAGVLVMDKMVGKDFEEGLVNLNREAKTGPKTVL